MRSEREVIVLLTCEPREVVHDDEVNLALVSPAVLQQVLQFAPVRRLGALTLLMEALENFEAVASAVLFAGTQLGGQTEVLGLLFRADANVDHRADHLRQLSADIGRRQGASSRHGS